MPSVNDVVELIQALESKPVLVVEEKCVAVRNRNSSCRKCMDACPVDGAVSVGDNLLTIDAESCVACGACTTVCPVEALVSLAPMDADLADQVASACLETGGDRAIIACARMAAKHIADPRRFAQVPCICRVDESLIVGLASRGVKEIVLVDGTCRTCRYRDTRATFDAMAASANDLLQAWGSDARAICMSEFPSETILGDDRAIYGRDRRNFFGEAKETAKDAALAAANQTLKLEEKQDKPSLRDRLSVGAGKMPQFEAVRRMNTLDSLDRIGDPQVDTIDTHLWGRVTIDLENCNGCGMCAVFCPTGALLKVDENDTERAGTDLLLEFTCSECVQCNLCSDACIKGCLSVSGHVVTDELLDFEPRFIIIDSSTMTSRTSTGQFGFRI